PTCLPSVATTFLLISRNFVVVTFSSTINHVFAAPIHAELASRHSPLNEKFATSKQPRARRSLSRRREQSQCHSPPAPALAARVQPAVLPVASRRAQQRRAGA